MSHQFQQHFPIHTVKGFFKIYEIHRRVPFDGLFDNDPKGGNLVVAVVPEASLVFPQFLIYPLLEPMEQDAVEHFPRC